MTIKDLLDTIEKLEARANTYWNFYSVVIIAICGWVFSQRENTFEPQFVSALMIGNGLFYFMNLSVIYGTTARLVAFESELIRLSLDDQTIGKELKHNLSNPYLKQRLPFTIATHLIMDVAVLSFIYLGLIN